MGGARRACMCMRVGVARVSVSENGAPSEDLDARWQEILEQQAKAQQERKTGQRRRASRRADEKMPGYKLPEIVVVQDGGGGEKAAGLEAMRVCVSKKNPSRAYII